MYCGKCGRQIEENAKICKWCGEPTGIEQETKPEAKPETSKTALGVSVCLMGAGVYWLGLVSDLAAIILIGYILLKEKDIWLRAVALKSVTIIAVFAALGGIFYIIQNVLDGFNSLLVVVGSISLGYTSLYQICGLLLIICKIVKDVILLVSGYQAWHFKNFRLGFLDKIVNKSIDKDRR